MYCDVCYLELRRIYSRPSAVAPVRTFQRPIPDPAASFPSSSTSLFPNHKWLAPTSRAHTQDDWKFRNTISTGTQCDGKFVIVYIYFFIFNKIMVNAESTFEVPISLEARRLLKDTEEKSEADRTAVFRRIQKRTGDLIDLSDQ